jgi:hypothetical protein
MVSTEIWVFTFGLCSGYAEGGVVRAGAYRVVVGLYTLHVDAQ